jgi:DeoR family fructose operon transcriptional repressor
MLPTQRRQAILSQTRAQSAVSADALARQFGVSVETIRRDLRSLQDQGLLERVYGGATRPPGRSSEGSFAARSVRHSDRKRAIAALAASLVEPEETIVIDVGTTALEVARALPAAFRGRVLTSSVPAAMELSARDGVELMLADYYPPEVVVRRTIIAHTAASYVLADSSKLGVIAVHRVCPLEQITAVITDDEENDLARAALADSGTDLLTATSGPIPLTEAG